MSNQLLKYRRVILIVFHAGAFLVAYYLAFGLRFDFDIPENYFSLFTLSLPLVILIQLFIFDGFGLYAGWWRYVGMRDLATIFKASAISALAIIAMGYVFFRAYKYPRSIPILDMVLTIGLVGGSRFAIRSIREGGLDWLPFTGIRPDWRRVLILGAGDAGETLSREINRRPELGLQVMGYLDDSPYKRGVRIHGKKVLGGIDQLPEIAKKYEVQEVFIAIPSANRAQMKRVLDLCEETELPVKTIPGMDQLIDGRVTVSQLKKVEIEDLLGREAVELDKQAIGQYLRDKKVLVTGAAGSIGSEICRQALAYAPRELILLDQWENGIFEMGRELKAGGRQNVRFFVADITDRPRVLSIFQETRPEVVFHAAAYKHVPVMEDNPGEAVKNNVGGTRNLAEICEEVGCVKRFVMISTDKAINPTSIMGATKRIAERFVQYLSKTSKTKFITVRFGNVLGSAGSVIPIFKEQIVKGGPVTVTHPDMIRYFMTIPEASQLVLQAGAMGKGGEIFVLDMGEPVRIVELAESLIKLSGYKPNEDIKIEFTGIRPGEKLYEELYLDQEEHSTTTHPKVFIRTCCDGYPDDFINKLDNLIEHSLGGIPTGIIELISYLVPEYHRDHSPAGDAGAQPASSIPLGVSPSAQKSGGAVR